MSIRKSVLNWYLRRFEKSYLERAQEPADVRKNFLTKARYLFHAPRGTKFQPVTLGQQPGIEIEPESDGPTVLYFHGGAYVFGEPATHKALIATLIKRFDGRAFLSDYRKAPEYPFPAAIEDAEAAWLDLLARGEDPNNIVIGGDSAGGGLALALLALLVEKEHPLPAGLFAFSPLTDLTFSSASVRENVNKEAVLPASRVEDMANLYLGNADRKDPRASPIFANFAGAPPIYLMVGDTEILRDDSVRLATKLRDQNVETRFDLLTDVPHVWPIFHNTLPEAVETLDRLAVWITQQTRPKREN